MPFLVDSITMELTRHGLDSFHIIHPQLLVRRDVTGTLWEVVGSLRDARHAHDEIAESWTHIEIDTSSGVSLAELEKDLQRVLLDVRVAVEDYPKMSEAALRLTDKLETEGPKPPAETQALLRWLADNHFTFLGYREYDLVEGEQGMALVPVPGTGLGILRHDKRGSSSFAALPPEVRARAKDPQRLILTKANSRSTVHRPSYLDYIAIKRVNETGEPVGEYRFLGLYTHEAYHESIARIPVLRRKLAEVLERSGATLDSHDGKDLTEILEAYPREELFQISADELTPIALGVLHLRSHPRTRLFLRKDVYGRFMSCVVYLPRDRYTTAVRLRTQEILREALHGETVEYSATVAESPLARLLVVVRAKPGTALADVDTAELEARIVAAARSWDEDLAAEAARKLGDARARALLAPFAGAIPQTYKTDVPASYAVNDLIRMQSLLASGETNAFDLWEAEGYVGGQPTAGDRHGVWRLTIYRVGTPITLTDVLPRLQHMGVDVVDEHPYEFAGPLAQPFWIYDFGLRRTGVGAAGNEPVTGQFPAVAPGAIPPSGPVKALFEDALTALWQGRIEDDGFNALVLDAHLTWRQVVVLRAYAKYLRQAGITFSQRYIERVLAFNVPVTRLLLRFFESRFDPARAKGASERGEAIAEEIRGLLDEVEILDHDRILRSYLGLILATQRTNYFRDTPSPVPSAAIGDTPYLVLKLDAGAVPELPEPRPRFEAFVYSPRLEAVHLRFAAVARGGLRWSDRREDFRTEILGLAKAQEVKNSVIVPSGAKGGFVCKHLPDQSDREAYQAEVLACYKTFIAAMLDITDNLHDSKVVPPPGVVRHDGDDPYLVVAADKGTATFSDTANEISQAYGYWLGDAFASGGSEGYDHKKMGITARGAWESVKFHFATLGVDPQTTEFTVAGIGDMSGDVFGNGMLLSEHILLVAAFDHRHIFLDPAPRRRGELRRAAAAVRAAPLLVGGLRKRADLRRWRGVAAQRQVRPGVPAGQSGARARGDGPRDAAGPAHLRHPGGAGGPAVERRHRHLRQGEQPDPRRRRGPGQRRRPDRRRPVARQGGRRGRQPGPHPGGQDRVRPGRGAGQHRLHRQLGRRGHLRPRGQHQDPAPGQGGPRRTDACRPRRTAARDDRRGRRAGAAAELRPEPGAGRRGRAGGADAARALPVPAQAGTGAPDRAAARLAAGGQGDRRAPVRGPGADRAGVRRAAGPGEDLRGPAGA